jgi:signal transduction histidine kinase
MIFRIIQEACTNILKHADASAASISMQVRQKALYINIADNGMGFDQTLIKRGNGLNNIKNRVYLFNGSLWINSSPGKGCELVIKIPVTI